MARTTTATLGLALTALLLAQPAPAAPVDDLAAALAMPVAGGLVGASDGGRFAWVENAGGVRNVWIGGPDLPAHPLTRYTDDDGLELYDLAWSPDARQIAFVRGGDSEFPDGTVPNTAHAAEPPKQQVMLADVAGGAGQVIGEGHAPVFVPGGIVFTRKGAILLWQPGKGAQEIARIEGEASDLRLSPDGKRLLFIDNRDDHAFAALYDFGAKTVRYLAPGLSFATAPVFSPDGAKIAFIRYVEPPARGDDGTPSYWAIEVADAATGEVHTLWRAPTGKGGRYAGTRQQNLWWTADNSLLFPWERSGWLHVYALDAAKGGTPQELTPGAFEVETFALDTDRRTLLFVGNVQQTDQHRLWRLAPGGTMRRVSGFAGSESAPALSGGAVAVIATDATHPAHIALAGKDDVPLGPDEALGGAVTPRAVAFTAADGVIVHGQLFEGTGPGPHPGLIFVHGGPRRQMLAGFHPMGYYSNAYVLNQHFAAQGFTVLSVNYRSGTGYGHDFREAKETARDGASEYRDVLAGGKWLASQHGVDPERIGIWGGSWGGYLTALALARDSDLFRAGVDFHGVHTMLRPLSDSLSPEEQAKARQLQWDSSPFGALDTWRSPVLLIHGDDDMNVPFAQSPLLARELTARHVPYEELVFPDERHEFLRYADWLKSYRATVDFLDRHLAKRSAAK